MFTQRSGLFVLAILFGAILSVPVDSGWAQPRRPPRDDPPPRRDAEDESLAGTVVGFNYNPSGEYESVMLKKGERLVQVNFPPEMSDRMAREVREGDEVQITARPERSRAEHDVFRLNKLTTKSGKELQVADDQGEENTIEGKLKAFNYDRQGERNGLILESGVVVQLGPRGAARLRLKVGDTVTVRGRARAVADHRKVINARQINGNEVERGGPPPRDSDQRPLPRKDRPRPDKGRKPAPAKP
jgi:hypothetical protein